MIIATDGSVSKDKIGGFGIYIWFPQKNLRQQYSITQSKFTHSNSCELNAIDWILNELDENYFHNPDITEIWDNYKCLIISDSLPSLKWINHDWYTHDNSIYKQNNKINNNQTNKY